jgi:hypothetical protein
MMAALSGRHATLVHFPQARVVTFAVWRTLVGDGEREVSRC